MTRKIIQAMPLERSHCVQYLMQHLEDAEFCFDKDHNPMETFLRSLEMAGDDPVIHMEDDIIITKDFSKKAEAAIAEHPDSIIQFFSMRQADLTTGSRWDSGSKYLMNQCWYSPPGYCPTLLDFHPIWCEAGTEWDSHQGLDSMVAALMKRNKERYWIHCPSLVDHRVEVSLIDKRRSSRRQSFTFTDPVE